MLNYEIQQMSFIPDPHPLYATQIFNPFLNSSISANHDKVERLSGNHKNPYKDDCFPII